MTEDETEFEEIDETEIIYQLRSSWVPGLLAALIALTVGIALGLFIFALLDADKPPTPPHVRIVGLSKSLTPGQQYTATLQSTAHRFTLAYSDTIDVTRHGHTLHASADRPGPAWITVRAIRGDLVSKPARWHGSVLKALG